MFEFGEGLMAKKELVCSISMKNLIIQTFRCGGKGGQNVNKVETGVRLTHPPSGAVAQSCTHRKQFENKREALRRLANTPEFKLWAKKQAAQYSLSEVELQ